MKCPICEKGPIGSDPARAALCTDCERLFDWFVRHFDDEKGHRQEAWITAETTFLDLSVESLDYIEWATEAEEYFGVVIAGQDAERLRSVGDFIGYIRFNSASGKPTGGRSPRPPGGSDPMWDRQMDA